MPMTEYEKWCEEMNLQACENRLEQDIVVLDNVHGVPLMDTEYHTHYYYIGMCLSGYTLGTYDYHPSEFRAGDICWIMPDHVISHNYVSDDYRVLSVYIKKSMYARFMEQGALGKYHYPLKAVCLSLAEDQFAVVADAFRTIGRLAGISHPQREDLLASMCRIISTLCDEFILKQHSEFSGNMQSHEVLFERFYQLIVRHYRESREVAFYADKPRTDAQVFRHGHQTDHRHDRHGVDQPLCAGRGQVAVAPRPAEEHPADSLSARIHRAGLLQPFLQGQHGDVADGVQGEGVISHFTHASCIWLLLSRMNYVSILSVSHPAQSLG